MIVNQIILKLTALLLNLVFGDQRSTTVSDQWTLSCQDCGPAFQQAIQVSQCIGQTQCRSVVAASFPNCTICVDQLMNNSQITVGDQSYLICWSENNIQKQACSYYCRAKSFSRGESRSLFYILPACVCIDKVNETATTRLTTVITTTPLSTTRTTTYIMNNATMSLTASTTSSAAGSIILTIKGHSSDIMSLTVLQNGNIVSGSDDRTIKIWDQNDGSLIRTLEGSESWVAFLEVLQDGSLISKAGSNLTIWDQNNGTAIRTIPIGLHTVQSLAILQNGNIAEAIGDRDINIRDQNNGSIIRTLTGHTSSIEAIVTLQNGNIASAAYDKSIKIWDQNNGSLIRTLTGHTDGVNCLAVLPNGNLVSGSYDQTIKIWDQNSGTVIRTLTGYNVLWALYKIVAFPNGNLASASSDVIGIWNSADGSLLGTFKATRKVWSMVVLQNGNLVIGLGDSTINILKIF